MRGTTGSSDYLMIAKNGDIGLGVKPLFESHYLTIDGKHGTVGVFAVRLRSAPLDHAAVPKHVIVETWPEIKFKAVDSRRASAIIGGPVWGKKRSSELLAGFALQNVDAALTAKILALLGDQVALAPADEIKAFLLESFIEKLGPDRAGPLDGTPLDFASYLNKTHHSVYDIVAQYDHVDDPYDEELMDDEELADEED
jgi:hypothetical protein